MTDFRAIAGVSNTLKLLLVDRMEDSVEVTIAPPDVIVDGVTGRRLNLYLFKVTDTSSQWIPGHGHPSDCGHPLLSLDLHYLLTAYGPEARQDADLEAQRILGDAMRVLHDVPIVTDAIVITRATTGTVGDPIMDPSLFGGSERLEITYLPLTLDDLSSFWASLPKANFRCSVAYQVRGVKL